MSSKHTHSDSIFTWVTYLILLSLSTTGFGNYLFGVAFPTDISTIILLAVFLILVITNYIRISRLLIAIYLYIIVHIIIIYPYISNISTTITHLLGFIVFSISIFSYISIYKYRIQDIIHAYYSYTFVISVIAILQLLVYISFGYTALPQNIMYGFDGNIQLISFSPEILGIFPRAVGLSSEPAAYCMIMLPGVFISLMRLVNVDIGFKIRNKRVVYTILISYLLSFSLVGYFGLLLCILYILKLQNTSAYLKLLSSTLFIVLSSFIMTTTVGDKVLSILDIRKDVKSYEFRSSDLSAFALISNLYVALEALDESNYIGTGFNTHKDNYDRTIFSIFNTEQVVSQLNKQDAGSLFIRLLSEFGIPGVIIFIIYLKRYHIKGAISCTYIRYYNDMSLIYMISYSARNGGYLNTVFILFVALYYYTYIMSKR